MLVTPTKEQQEEESSAAPAPSPSGVNRRTAVLFSKKAFRKSQPPTPPSGGDKPVHKRPGRPPKSRIDKEKKEEKDGKEKERDRDPSSSSRISRLPEGPCLSARSPKSPASPRSPGGHKRSASMSLATEAETPTAKRSLSLSEPPSSSEGLLGAATHRTSFMMYRDALPVSMSDIDTTSESSSTDGTYSDDDSQDDSGSENGDSGTRKYSQRGKLGSAGASVTQLSSLPVLFHTLFYMSWPYVYNHFITKYIYLKTV